MYEIGKSDPFNRIFVKTFNQITNNYFLEKGIRINDNINIKEDFKNSDEIKKNLKVFSRDHQGHYILAIDIFKKIKYLVMALKVLGIIVEKLNMTLTLECVQPTLIILHYKYYLS